MPIYQRSSPIGMLTDDTKAKVAAAITEAHVEVTGAPRYPRDLGVEVVVVEEHVHEHRDAHLSAHRTPGEILREAARSSNSRFRRWSAPSRWRPLFF